jgi:hypothetical protein
LTDLSRAYQGLLFPDVADARSATQCNIGAAPSQRPINTVNHNVGVSFEASESDMTAISATSSSFLSPLQQLQKELQAELAAGKISSTDQDALSSALTDIDSALQSSRSSGSSAKASPEDVKSKIDELIAGEVSSGTLTSDQAAELKEVFANAFAGGDPGGPPPSDSTTSTDSSSGSSISDILQQFLETLQEQLAASSSSYSASGTAATGTTGSGSFTALLIDYQT